ncbi:hypothetical protein VHEMI10285 [[Torrubiella] hemipterigena]|uniref:Zn(2)-C6 fungal-type domain-containing protein n=1 Tax=[Torrubiella] hemipterigena TaxID=1531966 RepID=A0A0A1TRX3_9HYPO|nr:hypothetical protein VHEMI10285 [[Torrubiella] hemipterigena]
MPKRSQAGSQPDSQKRKRVYAACNECRRRRRKCDGNEPCASCDGYGYSCTYGNVQSPGELGDSSIAIRLHSSTPATGPQTEDPSGDEGAVSSVATRERGDGDVATNSAIALPRLVGRDMGVENPPRLHSFAWNLGIRPERRGTVGVVLSSYLTYDECRNLSSTYFTAVHPMFPFLSKESYFTRLQQKWQTLEEDPSFTAVVAGVSALGSFFSKTCHPNEESIKQHCFSILDLALSTPISPVDIESIAGWMLRAIYARLTTRPAVACLSIHTAIHMVDIISMRYEIASRVANSHSIGKKFEDGEADVRSSYYKSARFLDTLFSAEYGIFSVNQPRHRSNRWSSLSNVDGDHLTIMAGILHESQQLDKDSLSSNMDEQFRLLESIADEFPAISLFKAAVCLCLLRQYVPAGRKPGQLATKVSIAILTNSFEDVRTLITAGHPWWNLLMVPFHSACICLAFDNEPYLGLLPLAVDLLRMLADTYRTHMAKDALNTVLQLVEASKNDSDAKLKIKAAVLAQGGAVGTDMDWFAMDPTFSVDDWPTEFDFTMY